MRLPLRIQGDQLSIENEIALKHVRSSTTFGKRLLSTFLWRENSVTGAGILGHAGEGNFHVAFNLLPNDPKEMAETKRRAGCHREPMRDEPTVQTRARFLKSRSVQLGKDTFRCLTKHTQNSEIILRSAGGPPTGESRP